MKKMIKLATVSMLALSALTAVASAQSFGIGIRGNGFGLGFVSSNDNAPNYYAQQSYAQPSYGYAQQAYAHSGYASNSHIVYRPVTEARTVYVQRQQAEVVYRPVTEARTVYVQRQKAYVAQPIVQQVVSTQYVQRSYVEQVPVTRTYTQAVPHYSSRVVGYNYQAVDGGSYGQRAYYRY
jgi:hypothetical protein